MLRHHAPQVGLATSSTPITPDRTATTAYDARIMHRAVAAVPERLTVVRDASDEQLAHALGISPDQVRASILTSRTPIVDPRPPATPANPHTCASAAETTYRRPVMLPISLLQRYRDMAVDLRTRLEALENATPRRNKQQYYAPVKPEALSIDASTSSDDSSVVGSFEPTSIIPVQRRNVCGFSKRGRFVGSVQDSKNTIVRRAGGLYSGARHSRFVSRGESCYLEFYLEYAGGQGGIAIGVANQLYSIDKMVGLGAGSMAIHSDAKFVRAGKWSQADTAPFGTGDTVGVCVSVGTKGRVVMRVHVNSEFVGEIVGDDALSKNVAAGQGVQVMVSMLRPGTRVVMNCCPSRWRNYPFEGRSRVGALCGDAKKCRVFDHDDHRTSAVLTP